MRGDGSKVVTKEGRQGLARVSVVDGRGYGPPAAAPVIMDDYVVQSEPVVDYLTRFSGITPGAYCSMFGTGKWSKETVVHWSGDGLVVTVVAS